FPRYVFDSNTSDFFRLKIFYKSFFSKTDHLTLDVNRKASVFLQPQKQKIPHFYESIPQFEIVAINLDELIAEKIRALITRNQPRDYFDAYMILEKGYKINFKLVRKKLADVKQNKVGHGDKPIDEQTSRIHDCNKEIAEGVQI
ncbi:MAG: nucleotidyl transferase AbiEii/AbiGii toxin family protein, partial [Elusimicrobiota bacterium]|nr:nucleotidyl transferase AbiEii/AbiGii toxin family protein [Elusimicrobiota bacterium]